MDIHGPQRMNQNDFGDRLTFLLVPNSGQSFLLYPVDIKNYDVSGYRRV